MENQNDHGVQSNSEVSAATTDLLKKSAELKRRNAEVLKKLEILKEQTEEYLHNQSKTDEENK